MLVKLQLADLMACRTRPAPGDSRPQPALSLDRCLLSGVVLSSAQMRGGDAPWPALRRPPDPPWILRIRDR